MDILIAFVITLALITLISIRYRISPFFTLIGGSILFGQLAGMTLDATLSGITAGIGKVFSAFGIIILCGAVIAKLLQEQHLIEDIVADIRQRIHNPPVLSGVSGYLLAVPITCCITAYILLNPIIDNLEKDPKKRNVLLYLTAIGAIISYALVYPTPVIIPLFETFSAGMDPLMFDAITIPLSLLTLAGILFFFRRKSANDTVTGTAAASENGVDTALTTTNPVPFHWRAWSPFIAIGVSVPVSLFILNLSQMSMINFIMLVGAVTALVLAPQAVRSSGLSQGARHAGIIIFDICGAGALGFVIVKSGFAQAALGQLIIFIPVILIPFLFAALIETAQGSRVVTAVITAEVLAGSVVAGAIHPLPLILLISAGSCVVSYVTDPFFWLVQRTTGDDIGTVVRNYTLPIAIVGFFLFFVALGLENLFFR